MALETPSRPPPPHGKCHLKFPFWFFETFPNLYNGHAILCRFREQRRNLEEDVEEIKKAGITDVMVLMQVRLMTSSSFSYIVTMLCRLQSFASTECLDYSRSTPRRVLRSTTYPWRMDVCPASLFFWKQSLGYKRWTPDDTDMMTNP